MITSIPTINSSRLSFRALTREDITHNYLSWMSDPSVNKFLESRHNPLTIDSLISYWESHHSDFNSPWFAICLVNTGQHIGNIKIGPIHPFYQTASIGLLIGEKKFWGMGFATESITAITSWAFSTLHLHKLTAGVYAPNSGSLKAFLKAGYHLEATLHSEAVLDGSRIDILRLAKFSSDF